MYYYLIVSVDQETIFILVWSSAQDGIKLLAGEAVASEARDCLPSLFRSLTEFRIGCMTKVPVFLLAQKLEITLVSLPHNPFHRQYIT